jgi:hypothetical protein
VWNLTRFKCGEKVFVIPSASVYVILEELEKIEDEYKVKTIRTLIKSSKRNNVEITSNIFHNTVQWGSKRFLRKKLMKNNMLTNY